MDTLNIKFHSGLNQGENNHLEIRYDEEENNIHILIEQDEKWAEINLNRETAVHLNKLMRKEISKIKTS